MTRRISISEARARLPELARYVTESPEHVVVIEHRDLPGALALTTAGHLDYLTTRIRELETRVAPPFRLAGSMMSDLSDEDLEAELQAIREEQRLLSEAKLRSLDE